jgi:hypothetical protein
MNQTCNTLEPLNLTSPTFWQVNSQFNITVQTGYNLLSSDSSSFASCPVKRGWMLGFWLSQAGGNIAIDTSAQSLYNDYQIQNVNITSSNNLVTGLLVSLNNTGRYMMRAHVLQSSLVSLSKLYTKSNVYSVNITVMSNNSQQRFSRDIYVQDTITNLTINGTWCIGLQSCAFTATYQTGTNLTLNWTIMPSDAGSCVSSSSNSSVCNFTNTAATNVSVSVVASNLVSIQTCTKSISVIYSIQALDVHTNNCPNNLSYSSTNMPASFTLNVTSVTDYSCLVDFGDMSSSRTLNSSQTFSNAYKQAGDHTLNVNCTNSVGQSKSFAKIHQVQDLVTGLSIVNNTVSSSVDSFIIPFQLIAGTNVQFRVIFNGTSLNYTYSNSNLTGYVTIGKKPVGTYLVTISAWNLVSNNTIYAQDFYVEQPIDNATISSNQSFFIFGTDSPTWVINMANGSNVQLQIDFGDSNLLLYNKTGLWSAPYNVSHTYRTPGVYNVVMHASNRISNTVASISTIVISRVDGLMVQLLTMPIYSQSFGYATVFFQFSCDNTTYAGSDSNVTIYPYLNQTTSVGPLPLNMDYSQSPFVSTTTLSNKYTETGNFTVRFLVQNRLGSKNFSLNFTLTGPSDLIFLTTTPVNIITGSSVSLNVFILNNVSATIQWFVDGLSLGTPSPKNCKHTTTF